MIDIDKRDKEIRALHMAGYTMRAIGSMYGISRERVRQLLRRTPCTGPLLLPDERNLKLRAAGLRQRQAKLDKESASEATINPLLGARVRLSRDGLSAEGIRDHHGFDESTRGHVVGSRWPDQADWLIAVKVDGSEERQHWKANLWERAE